MVIFGGAHNVPVNANSAEHQIAVLNPLKSTATIVHVCINVIQIQDRYRRSRSPCW